MRYLWMVMVIGLAACGANPELSYKGGANISVADSAPPPPPPAPQMAREFSAESPGNGSTLSPTPVQSFLAYRYTYGYQLPYGHVKSVMEAHMERCMAAGPALCQVLSSSSQSYSDDNVSAYLQLRAEPEFLDGFEAEISESVDAAKGELTNSNVSVEDLTRQILDTDARLKAQTALRDRLQGLLETRDADLADLLSVERELARVQGEIESATSILNALRQRVSMSIVTINYETKMSAVSRSKFSPIGQALGNFTSNVASGLAVLINLVALVLPWLLFLILPLILLIRWVRRRRKVSKAT